MFYNLQPLSTAW